MKKEKKGRKKTRKSNRCSIERKHICANPTVYIVKSFWIGGTRVGANNAIYQGFPDGTLISQRKFPRNRDTTNYAPPIRKTIRYRSPRIRYETKRLSRKCFARLLIRYTVMNPGKRGSKRADLTDPSEIEQ